MTEKRHFYTDPLAAAWMAKHCDMQLYLGIYPDDFDSYGSRNWQHCQDDWFYRQVRLGQVAPRFYIHPDSLPLLEPRPRDLIRFVNADADSLVYRLVKEGEDTSYSCEDWFRIVDREKKSFMWPETED